MRMAIILACLSLIGTAAFAEPAPPSDTALAKPYYERASIFRAKNDYDDAIPEYSALLDLFPNDAAAFNERGRSYAIEGDNAHAIADYDSAIALDPNFASAHFNRGVARYSVARFAQAASDFAFAARAEPVNLYPALWLHLARGKARNQDKMESSNTTAGLDSWPGPLLRFYRGEASAQEVRTAAAKVNANEQPAVACQAAFYIGEYEMVRRNVNAAVPILQDAATNCPHDLPEYDGAIAELGWLP
jgi:lipoprotein NlpI